LEKVLIISYYWPPSSGSGVQRWMYFGKYLPEFGVEPTIITVDDKYASYPAKDLSFEKHVSHLRTFKRVIKLLISALNIFPIKGCAGILSEYLDVRESGPAVRLGGQFVGDRQLMFVGPDGEFKTQRTHPQLSLLLPRIENQNFNIKKFQLNCTSKE
jgi:hypothetical protein